MPHVAAMMHCRVLRGPFESCYCYGVRGHRQVAIDLMQQPEPLVTVGPGAGHKANDRGSSCMHTSCMELLSLQLTDLKVLSD